MDTSSEQFSCLVLDQRTCSMPPSFVGRRRENFLFFRCFALSFPLQVDMHAKACCKKDAEPRMCKLRSCSGSCTAWRHLAPGAYFPS